MCVVGSGVIGLTCAVRLAEAGNSVHIAAARPAAESVSALAAAMWFPYKALPQTRVLAWAMASLSVFELLAGDPETGVSLRYGIEVHRHRDPDLWWAEELSDVRRLDRGDLPTSLGTHPRILGGLEARLPIIVMSRYLAWLGKRCADLGVTTSTELVTSVTDAGPSADAVVLAVGLGASELLADTAMQPIRGQVVRLANPGLTDWVLDEGDPTQLCYVIPRPDDVVCGGTADFGQTSLVPDPRTEATILARARALVPALAGAPVVSRAVGLRPGRRTVRLERLDDSIMGGRPLVACYGHGGAGVTLSWGCADEVASLIVS